MKPGANPCVLIGPRGWETPPPSLAKRVSGLAGVPGPGVSFTKVNETKGTGWGEWGGRESRGRGYGNAPISGSPGLTTVGGARKTSWCAGDPGPGPPRSGLAPWPLLWPRGMLETPRGSSTEPPASGEAAGGGGRENVRDSPPRLQDAPHFLTAANADSRAWGGRRWDSGLEGALELWA